MLNHVLMHQTVIGEEALKQFAAFGESMPDLIVGCTGGGSNFAGLFLPFLREKLAGRGDPVFRAVEPTAAPSFTRGRYAYDFGDTAGFTPLLKMHTLGHDFIPDPVHAGGLRYHGMSPLLSHVYELGLFEAVAKPQRECFAAAVTFARAEGIIPAPEPSHALAAVVEEAKRCTESGEPKVILTALCGHGHFDMARLRALPVRRDGRLRPVPGAHRPGSRQFARRGLIRTVLVRGARARTSPARSMRLRDRTTSRSGKKPYGGTGRRRPRSRVRRRWSRSPCTRR